MHPMMARSNTVSGALGVSSDRQAARANLFRRLGERLHEKGVAIEQRKRRSSLGDVSDLQKILAPHLAAAAASAAASASNEEIDLPNRNSGMAEDAFEYAAMLRRSHSVRSQRSGMALSMFQTHLLTPSLERQFDFTLPPSVAAGADLASKSLHDQDASVQWQGATTQSPLAQPKEEELSMHIEEDVPTPVSQRKVSLHDSHAGTERDSNASKVESLTEWEDLSGQNFLSEDNRKDSSVLIKLEKMAKGMRSRRTSENGSGSVSPRTASRKNSISVSTSRMTQQSSYSSIHSQTSIPLSPTPLPPPSPDAVSNKPFDPKLTPFPGVPELVNLDRERHRSVEIGGTNAGQSSISLNPVPFNESTIKPMTGSPFTSAPANAPEDRTYIDLSQLHDRDNVENTKVSRKWSAGKFFSPTPGGQITPLSSGSATPVLDGSPSRASSRSRSGSVSQSDPQSRSHSRLRSASNSISNGSHSLISREVSVNRSISTNKTSSFAEEDPFANRHGLKKSNNQTSQGNLSLAPDAQPHISTPSPGPSSQSVVSPHYEAERDDSNRATIVPSEMQNIGMFSPINPPYTLQHLQSSSPSPSLPMVKQDATCRYPQSPVEYPHSPPDLGSPGIYYPDSPSLLDLGSKTNSVFVQSQNKARGQSQVLSPMINEEEFHVKQLIHDPHAEIMTRFHALLDDRKTPINVQNLNTPERKLLLHQPMLQIVNNSTVKDRYLLLFNDILIIGKLFRSHNPHPWKLIDHLAKPILVFDRSNRTYLSPSLENKFLVKSVVEVNHLKVMLHKDDETPASTSTKNSGPSSSQHPLILSFISRFSRDPPRAVKVLLEQGGLGNDPAVIANLLVKTVELDRAQLALYLAVPSAQPVLHAYMDRFRMSGMRIDYALRSVLSQLYLSADAAAVEALLNGFCIRYHTANSSILIGVDQERVTRLVFAIMELNDAFHSGSTPGATNLFSFPNQAISVEDFTGAFRVRDPKSQISNDLLSQIYTDICKHRIELALEPSKKSSSIPVTFEPPLQSRLTLSAVSQQYTVRIPNLDPQFVIKLIGNDLDINPPELSFARSNTASFNVKPRRLGPASLSFIKLGNSAPMYHDLPVSKGLEVEEPFMQNSFQITFVNHMNVRRKYLFGVKDKSIRNYWVAAIRKAIAGPLPPSIARFDNLAYGVSLQVLRDALISPDELNLPASSSQITSYKGGGKTATRDKALKRTQSISKLYSSQRSEEGGPRPTADPPENNEDFQSAKRGSEIMVIAQQNSLMPMIIGFLNLGLPPRK